MSSDQQIWDPLRRRLVALTPEEKVRQWFIGFLRDTVGVPPGMMMSEVGMKYGVSGKEYRADILVYDRALSPLLLVECKRPSVELSPKVLEQTLRYDMVLSVKYIAITNGINSYICERREEGFVFLDYVPTYLEMLK